VKTADVLDRVIENAPRSVGVYLMKDRHEKVIYVGKAKNLRARVRSYFGGKDARPSVPFLVARIHDIEFIVTNTEKEALILENNLIKEHRPRYNVYFRDDKDYINLRIDPRESFPRFQVVRRPPRDGALYLGPYASSSSVKETLHFIQPVFPLRTCSDVEFKNRKRPCIEHEIKRCTAPCVGMIGREDYLRLVDGAVAFLRGRERKVLADLRRNMTSSAQRCDFEEAARIRDMITSIERTLEKQQVVSMSRRDVDVFGLYQEDGLTRLCVIQIRMGRIVGRIAFPPIKKNMESAVMLSSLLKQYYDPDVFVPSEILIPENIEDRRVVEEWLTEKREGRVRLVTPAKHEKKALVEMAVNNAKHLLETDRAVRHEAPEKHSRRMKQAELLRPVVASEHSIGNGDQTD